MQDRKATPLLDELRAKVAEIERRHLTTEPPARPSISQLLAGMVCHPEPNHLSTAEGLNSSESISRTKSPGSD